MELSIFLARIWGWAAILLCTGLLVNRKQFFTMLKSMSNESLFLGGILALGIGIAQVVGYEMWNVGWTGLITLLGWLSLAKGLAILFWPEYMQTMIKVLAKKNFFIITLTIGFLIGVYLVYSGYIY